MRHWTRGSRQDGPSKGDQVGGESRQQAAPHKQQTSWNSEDRTRLKRDNSVRQTFVVGLTKMQASFDPTCKQKSTPLDVGLQLVIWSVR